ncbi:MAG TPA: multifunctional oxoglutarate decarboxylase/oxoglutarate dehydrogenase thiamine pyrophosphate-binding subunit/dihydrolipoyllysine-residue succinyltransferase subunit, partial [Propionibacteriaceae bacterium]|nr:multifunctional oxoglutarate decarboxylase/oxoglutarate dehydrogenase thiamine pyrophosphate-binding subunit/dihydrolipoyllysine-residue succinyltransferase subunit [Propionibacteriaceae bacterium]
MDDFGANDWLIEELFEQYTADPSSVDPTWAAYFSGGGAPSAPTPPATTPATAPAASGITASPKATGPSATASEPGAGGNPDAATVAKANSLKSAPAVPADLTHREATTPTPKVEAPAEASPVVDEPTTDSRLTSDPPPAPSAEPTPAPAAPPPPPTAANVPAGNLRPTRAQAKAETSSEPTRTPLKGAPLRTAKNMEASLEVPTATSVRTVPMKLVIDQRTMINTHLKRTTGGKVSFTHIIGFAMVQALKAVPAMNVAYDAGDGKPVLVDYPMINLGLAIDMAKSDGTRQLLVPNIKGAESMDFHAFWQAYEAVVKKARSGSLTVDDFQGTTATLTNPGGIGTNHSIPRLMSGQGLILGVGSIEYAPGFLGASPERLNELGVSRVMTLTSTYDHRVIQGAQSGEFLKVMEGLLRGDDEFFGDIFTSLRIPYAPLRWDVDEYVSDPDEVCKAARVLELINAYRELGHLMADIDPLQYRLRSHPDLELSTHGLSIWDLDRKFPVGKLGGSKSRLLPLRETLELLRDAYCRTVGVEYMHIQDSEQRHWLQQRLEQGQPQLTHAEHVRILDRLNEAEIFETFLQTKFVGQKRFSLEGGESTIVALDEICDQAADAGLDEVCIGMPHRGRLNVLANIVGKSYGQIFREFEGRMDPTSSQGTGDVKYHLGAEGEFTALSGAVIRTSVAANPSHLEAVNPVVEGIARAKQDRSTNELPFPVLPILLHGDAAFSGQGVVYETLQMSQLRGYRTGGTIHIVVNNQVGFTTAPSESRSSTYCTDVAKAIQSPVFHVNGDDADACVRVARLAFEFRQRFGKDVVIDLVCYRRRGHNEGDDPSFTQPLMYDLIEQKRSTRKLYTESLIGRGDISTEDADEVLGRFRDRLETVFREVRALTEAAAKDEEYHKVPYYPAKLGEDRGTAITPEQMARIADAQVELPEGFSVHPKVLPQMERRADSIRNGP